MTHKKKNAFYDFILFHILHFFVVIGASQQQQQQHQSHNTHAEPWHERQEQFKKKKSSFCFSHLCVARHCHSTTTTISFSKKKSFFFLKRKSLDEKKKLCELSQMQKWFPSADIIFSERWQCFSTPMPWCYFSLSFLGFFFLFNSFWV